MKSVKKFILPDSGSRYLGFRLLLLFCMKSFVVANAGNFYSWPNPSGSAPYNWDDKNNWSSDPNTRTVPNNYPKGPDDVQIRSGHTITLNLNLIGGVGFKSLTVDAGGVLTYSGTGGFDVNPSGPIIVNGSVTVYCIYLKNNATLTVMPGGYFSTVSCNTLEGANSILQADGTVSIAGSFANSGRVQGTGTFTLAAGTVVSGSGTVYGVVTNTISTTTSMTVGAYTWTGGTSTAWGTSGNWANSSVGQPTSSTDNVAILKNTGGNDPHIVATGRICGKLTINAGNKLYIDNGYDLTSSDSLVIKTGSTNGKLVIKPGGKITANGKLVNNCDTAGILIESDATTTGSLLHISDNVKGNIKRYIAGSSVMSSHQYHLVSVPLTSSSGNLFSSLFIGSYLYDFTESTGSWNLYGSSTILPLSTTRGFMIFYPSSSTTYSFPGPMNNGSFTATVSFTDDSHGFNLVPNPYPSAIDWNASSGWTKTNIGATIYTYNPSSGNYENWNGSTGSTYGSRYIPVGQAFFVQASGTSPALSMNNSVRVHSTNSFLKNSELLPNSIRIKATGNKSWDEAVLVFSDQGTNVFDQGFDAQKFYGNEGSPQIYIKSPDNYYVSIKAFPFSQTQVVIPVGFELKTNGKDTLSFEGTETFDPKVSIYLHDLKTGSNVNLRQQQHYVFDHLNTDDPLRFNLQFNGITGSELKETGWANIYKSGSILVADISDLAGRQGRIIFVNELGQVIRTENFINTNHNTFEIPNSQGLLIAQLILEDKTIVKKIMNLN